MSLSHEFFGRSPFEWVPVVTGESGDFVYQRSDGRAYAKVATADRSAELSGERDRLLWLQGKGILTPEVTDWHIADEGACLIISAIEGIPAVDLSAADLLEAWPSMAWQLGSLHALDAGQCPFDRGLAPMFARAADVVARDAVNADFLAVDDQETPAHELLARVERELAVRLEQETGDRVVCHGDPCMPNFMIDPRTLRCSGMIDLGRLGTADRYADLALMTANARESWTSPDQEQRAFAILFDTLGIVAPDRARLDFYLRLDPLTWG
ncbi:MULTISPECIES: APH(3'') family aminoglycoside O-phosphotransferase [unclassified Ensifer]|uniref:APH(3'') family aminoglycoside O-phosphotransferase n=1 Tax=unclassified Ensifer TaxID=2633371 RepID=UPI00070A3577|nr:MULTISPECIES: APH(3'') family aminoglycoside O-phosphotransferase [unclassified Ensifer]KQY74929.1 aminoglycoside phosphotransferase [Ensifer sp. Root142]MBD9489774.1 APH(3'') family aminoglycoside O-phosphotransferase [Ensifer sp. ENS11]MDP9633195.1 streptomycin 3'-kinase [Ensifer adhaerens]